MKIAAIKDKIEQIHLAILIGDERYLDDMYAASSPHDDSCAQDEGRGIAYYASVMADYDVVKFLMQKGASIDKLISNFCSTTPSIYYESDGKATEAMQVAAIISHEHLALKVLLCGALCGASISWN
jgi:hypothetical protein